MNDTRVDVWMTLKTGSRFAAATNSDKPVLMRLKYEGGHGGRVARCRGPGFDHRQELIRGYAGPLVSRAACRRTGT